MTPKNSFRYHFHDLYVFDFHNQCVSKTKTQIFTIYNVFDFHIQCLSGKKITNFHFWNQKIDAILWHCMDMDGPVLSKTIYRSLNTSCGIDIQVTIWNAQVVFKIECLFVVSELTCQNLHNQNILLGFFNNTKFFFFYFIVTTKIRFFFLFERKTNCLKLWVG